MKKILLKKTEKGWMASIPEYRNELPWIPTPFTALAKIETVIDALAPKNPGHEFEEVFA